MVMHCFSCMKQFDSKYRVCPYCGYNMDSGPAEPYHLNPGTIIQGRYIIGKAIGFGGFGTVYRTWDNVLNISVAIKEYYPAGIAQRVPGTAEVLVSEANKEEYKRGIEKFIQEAVNTSKFQKNENIVDVLTYFELNNTAYIVMEYLDGYTLAGYMEKHGGSLDTESSVAVLIAAIRALKVVHKERIVHRDLSPSNIFICRDGRIKLIDFGAARSLDDSAASMEEVELKPGFAPPEQYRDNEAQGVWTDVYALGATVYKALTGQTPVESVERQLNDSLKKPSSLKKGIPPYLDKILLRAMSLEPEVRFSSMDEFEQAVLQKRHVRTPEKEIRRRKRRRVHLIIAVTILILCVGIYALARYQIEKLNEVLPETTISVWMVANTEEEKEAKQTEFESYCEEFRNDFPQVSIEYVFYDYGQYEDAVNEAAVTGKTPDLFEAGQLTDYELFFAARKPSDLLEMLNKNEYYVYDTQSDRIKESRKIPIGLGAAIPAYNSSVMGASYNAMENTPQLFCKGVAPLAVLDITEYYEARDTMSGSYTILEDPYLDYSYEWCLGQTYNIQNQACANRLLYYLLGEKAQELIGRNTREGYIPIRKNKFDEYMGNNPELKYLQTGLSEGNITFAEKNNKTEIYNNNYRYEFGTLKKRK